MNKFKKFLRVFYSMKFAIVLLIILSIVCTIVSVIPQARVENYYITSYSALVSNLILFFGLDNAFTSWWFCILMALLCANLLLCSIIKYPQIIKNYKNGYTFDKFDKVKESFYIGDRKSVV